MGLLWLAMYYFYNLLAFPPFDVFSFQKLPPLSPMSPPLYSRTQPTAVGNQTSGPSESPRLSLSRLAHLYSIPFCSYVVTYGLESCRIDVIVVGICQSVSVQYAFSN